VGLAAARRALLCLRRRPAHGGRRRDALVAIAAEHGAMDERAAKAFVADLKKAGRYQADVY